MAGADRFVSYLDSESETWEESVLVSPLGDVFLDIAEWRSQTAIGTNYVLLSTPSVEKGVTHILIMNLSIKSSVYSYIHCGGQNDYEWRATERYCKSSLGLIKWQHDTHDKADTALLKLWDFIPSVHKIHFNIAKTHLKKTLKKKEQVCLSQTRNNKKKQKTDAIAKCNMTAWHSGCSSWKAELICWTNLVH